MTEYGDHFKRLTDDEFLVELDRITGTMRDLLLAKRRSYGSLNLTKFGEIGILIRASDKLERLAHMHRHGIDMTAVGEDAADAWRDLAGYALLALLVRQTEESGADGVSGTPSGWVTKPR